MKQCYCYLSHRWLPPVSMSQHSLASKHGRWGLHFAALLCTAELICICCEPQCSRSPVSVVICNTISCSHLASASSFGLCLPAIIMLSCFYICCLPASPTLPPWWSLFSLNSKSASLLFLLHHSSCLHLYYSSYDQRVCHQPLFILSMNELLP